MSSNLENSPKQYLPKKLLVVSSVGADAQSSIFYNRIKGEMENELKKLKIPSLEIFQPSLLIGIRTESRPWRKFLLN